MSTIPWPQIKALSFDIYGTLLDWENGIASAARSDPLLGPHLPQSHKDLLLGIEHHDTTIQKENPTLPQREIIARGLARYATNDLQLVAKGHLSQRQLDEACRAYGEKIGTYPAFADTVAAIQTLGKRYKLIPLSNVDNESFQQTLSGPLKECHFDAIYTAQDIGSYKPDVANFRYLLEHVKSDFGVEKDELIHVAQSLFHDHGPAKQVGLRSVWVDRRGVMGGDTEGAQEKYGFELRVETLGELARIVEEAFEKHES